jgi:hypothetical protein
MKNSKEGRTEPTTLIYTQSVGSEIIWDNNKSNKEIAG